MNFYEKRDIIRNPEDFCNREIEMKKIFSRIGGSRPQSISLVGERRMGKSFLLYHISNKKVRKGSLRNSEDYIFAFCDLKKKNDVNIVDFLTFVVERIVIEAPELKENLPRKTTYDSFLKLIQELDKRKKKVILVFDEFDAVMNDEKFGPEFFSYLRSIANSYNVAYITSSRKDLQEFPRTSEVKDSPFFNIFTRVPVGLFDEKSAKELISKLSKREGIPLEKHVKFIFKLAGFHPFFLQIACSNMVEYLNSHESIDENGFQTVEENFLDEAETHFSDMCKDLKDEEKLCLKAVAESEKLDQKLKFIARKLAKRGFLANGDGDYKIFSESFRNFILNKTRKNNLNISRW